MMERIDLWGNISDTSENADKILSLLEDQASLLTEKTDSRVTAVFGKIKYRYVSTDDNICKVISAVSSALVKADIGRKEEANENGALEDASSLYKESKYKFEISNKKYRYRLFTLNYSPVFPVSFEVEYGILDDKVKLLEIKSLEDAQDQLFEIFNSRKVKYIIQEMLKTSSDADVKN